MKNTIAAPAAALVTLAMAGLFAGCPGKSDTGSAPSAGTTAAPPAAAAPAFDPAKAATLKGTVKFEGAAPTQGTVDMSGTPECASMHATPAKAETLVVNDGKIKYAIVYVKSGLTGSFPPPTTPAMLDQKGCTYVPHVMTMQVGQPLAIHTSDPLLHNVNCQAQKNDKFNFGMPKQNETVTKKFKVPEIVKFRCDVHGWMSAWVGVFEHPFAAVTGDDGSFEIKGLPPGTYQVEVWHEKLAPKGMGAQSVTVGEKETKTVDFSLKG